MSREDYDEVNAFYKERRAEIEPKRMIAAVSSIREVEGVNAVVEENSVDVTTRKGQRFKFFPFKGWYQGVGNPKSGRGLRSFISTLKAAS